MRKRILSLFLLLSSWPAAFSQRPSASDSIFLMNGNIFNAQVNDTTGIVSVKDADGRLLVYENDQLYKIRFGSGHTRFYYDYDSLSGNWLTREEMWMYMKGERDARKGFKARGATLGACLAGLAGGMTGTFWGPVAPYGFMALTFIPKVKIDHSTVSDPENLKSDAYLMGYVRVARQKMKIRALVGGTAGLLAGYTIFIFARSYYPAQLNFGVK